MVEVIFWEVVDVHGIGPLIWRFRVRDLDDGGDGVVVPVDTAARSRNRSV